MTCQLNDSTGSNNSEDLTKKNAFFVWSMH